MIMVTAEILMPGNHLAGIISPVETLVVAEVQSEGMTETTEEHPEIMTLLEIQADQMEVHQVVVLEVKVLVETHQDYQDKLQEAHMNRHQQVSQEVLNRALEDPLQVQEAPLKVQGDLRQVLEDLNPIQEDLNRVQEVLHQVQEDRLQALEGQ